MGCPSTSTITLSEVRPPRPQAMRSAPRAGLRLGIDRPVRRRGRANSRSQGTGATVSQTGLVPAATTAATTETTATAAAAEAAATAAAGRTVFTRTRDVDGQRTAIQGRAVHRVDRTLRLFRRGHGDETEPAGPAALAVDHQVRLDHRAVHREGVVQVVFGRVEGQIAYVQFVVHRMLSPSRTELSFQKCSRTTGISNHH